MVALFPPFPGKLKTSQSAQWLEIGANADSAPRLAKKTAFQTCVNNLPLRVEILEWESAHKREADWSDLVSRCLEPNPFLEPAFALSGAQQTPPAHRPVFLFVSEAASNESPGRLIGLCVLTSANGKFGRVIRGWLPKLSAIGTPLLDRNRAAEALDFIFDWFARRAPDADGLMFPSMPATGPTAALIRARVLSRGLDIHAFDAHERAALFARSAIGESQITPIATKRMKELRRQRRKLEELGNLTWTSASNPVAVRIAFEKFMALEARGWKGSAGTALLSDPAASTFGRAMTRLLAHKGHCRIDALELDNHPIAMGITIQSGASAALWKIAYDESHAGCSPGVQFILDYTQRQIADESIAVTDSCAIPDHPMIDRLWHGRVGMVDLFIGTGQGGSAAFETAVNRESLRRGARAFVKRIWRAVHSGNLNQPRKKAA